MNHDERRRHEAKRFILGPGEHPRGKTFTPLLAPLANRGAKTLLPRGSGSGSVFYRADVQCDMLNLSWDGQ
jgi:hypothetical protein